LVQYVWLIRTRKANTWWWRWNFFIGNKPKRHDGASRPPHETLHHIGIGHGKESSTAGIQPNNGRRQENGRRIGNIPNITGNRTLKTRRKCEFEWQGTVHSS
jgi:hypothetical protein